MINRSRPVFERTFPWWQSGFDLEGIVGFLAGWLLGILLGMLWGPLFWIGFLPGLVLLFATRRADRVTPEDASLIVSPCDGVIVSVEDADVPDELRLPAGYRRVRISSSPFSSNNIHAPIAGSISHLVNEEGAAEAFAAMKPDSSGLEVLYITIGGDAAQAGLRVATGGLGPRLEARADAGDKVFAGKTIATRRLGGWCDVYVPAGAKLLVEPGRTLIGGETGLVDLSQAESVVSPEAADVSAGEAPPTPETVPPDAAAEADETSEDTRSSDPAEMFARLRREAGLTSDDPDTSEKG